MRRAKKALQLLAAALLLTAFATAVLWVDRSIQENGHFYPRETEVDNWAAPSDLGSACLFLESELGIDWKTEIVLKASPDGNRLEAAFEMSIPVPSQLADCLRGSRFSGDTSFVENHFGRTVVRTSDYRFVVLSVGDVRVVASPADDTAKVVASGSVALPSGATSIFILRNPAEGSRNRLRLGDVTFRAENASILRAEGASIRQQNSVAVEFRLVDPLAQVSVHASGVNADGAPAEVAESSDHLSSMLYFPLVSLAPWLAFVLISRSSVSSAQRVVRDCCGWLVLIVVVVGALTTVPALSENLLAFVILCAAVPMSLLLVLMRTDLVGSKWRFAGLLVTGVLVCVAAVIGAPELMEAAELGVIRLHVNYMALARAIVLGIAASALLSVVLSGRLRNWRHGVLFGAVCLAAAVVVQGAQVQNTFFGSSSLILWAFLVYTVVRRWNGGRLFAVVSAVAALFCMSPVHMMLANWSKLNLDVLGFSSYAQDVQRLAMLMLGAACLDLLIYLSRLLWLMNNSTISLDQPLLKACVIACVLVVAVDARTSSGYAGLVAAIVLAAGFTWLIRNDHNAVRLAAVTPAVHARLLRLDARRRSMLEYATAHYRAARAKVAAHEVQPDAAMVAQATLDAGAGHFRPLDKDGVMLLRAAQGSAGGRPPAVNALFGAAAGALISLPFAVWEVVPLIDGRAPAEWYSPLVVAVLFLRPLRWIAFAAAYGYCYPAIRGATPVVKAMALLVVLIPAELVLIDFTTPARLFLLAAGIKTGFLVVFCLTLGLAWEWWLARAANVKWGRIRDFTRMKSFLVPASTVLVAGVTALATGLAGAAVTGMLQNSPPARPEQSSAPPTTPPPTTPGK